MNRTDLEELEKKVMEEVVRRRKLGDYSQDAAGIRLLFEVALDVLRHLKERTPRPRQPND